MHHQGQTKLLNNKFIVSLVKYCYLHFLSEFFHFSLRSEKSFIYLQKVYMFLWLMLFLRYQQIESQNHQMYQKLQIGIARQKKNQSDNIQMTKIDQNKPKSKAHLINMGLIISLGNCCIGYASVCLSATEHLLKVHNRLSQNQIMYHLSIATGCLNLGAIIGALLYKRFQTKYGTLKAFTIVDLLCICFICIQLVDLNVYFLSIGRFFYGIFMTMSLAMTPSFLNVMSKTMDPSVIGTLGSFNQLLMVFGTIMAYIMSYILPQTIELTQIWTQIKWRIYIGLPIIFMLIRLRAVKTQILYKKVEQSLIVQSRKSISQKMEKQGKITNQRLSYRKRLIVGILVIASNQLSCINGIFFYSRQMMNLVTGNDQQLSKVLVLFLAFGQLLACMMGGKLLNKYGRKQIFIKGQCVIIAILILCFLLDMENPYLTLDIRHLFLGILINLHVIVFNLTLGPICIFYCSQILDDLKYIVFTLKCLSLFFALTSDIMIHTFGIGQMFLIFGMISTFVSLYLNKQMQETIKLDKQSIYKSFMPPLAGIPPPTQPQVKPFKANNQKIDVAPLNASIQQQKTADN